MSRVFISQQPRPNKNNWMPNLSPAMAFGRFIFVFGGDEQPWCTPDNSMEHAQQLLKDFDPEEDYVLWPNSGDPMAIWIIVAALARFPINKIRFLYWERKLEHGERSKVEGFYSPITLHLPL